MLRITGRYADGWWPAGAYTPEDDAAKLKVVRDAAERAGRDPMAIVPAITQICLIGDDDELQETLEAPLVKSIILMLTADDLRSSATSTRWGQSGAGSWISIRELSREKIIEFCARALNRRSATSSPAAPPIRWRSEKCFCHAGLRVFKMMEYGSMGGLKFTAGSAAKVRATEDELLSLVGGKSPRMQPKTSSTRGDARAGAEPTPASTTGATTFPSRFGQAVDHLNSSTMDADGDDERRKFATGF